MIVATLYTFCVVAPAAAMALSDGKLTAHCFPKVAYTEVSQSHDRHSTTSLRDHAAFHAEEPGAADNHAPRHSQSKSCCGISCMMAVPSVMNAATLGEVIAIKLRPASQLSMAGSQPDIRYRPPIIL